MSRLPDHFLDELRARVPIAAVIGRRVKLSRSGRNWKACCPFHGEKTPSFYVYDDGYHCFGCGAHGDAIGFVMQSQNADFMAAVTLLAGEAGLEVPKPTAQESVAARERLDLHAILENAAAYYTDNLFAPGGAAALAYLRNRGLTDDTIRRFGLGYSGEGRGALAQRLAGADVTAARLMEAGLLRPADDGSPGRELFFNRVMFPIRDRSGRMVSFGGRIMGDGQPKYVNGPETAVFPKRRTLYGLHLARAAVRTGATLVVVEGYMDVIALHQAGFGAAVAPLGTALTEDQLQALWALSPAPVLCFDGDAAGGRAAARAAEIALPGLAPDRTIRIATLPGGEDPDTLVRTQGAAAFEAILQSARPLGEALFGLLRETGGSAASDGGSPEQRAAFRARLEAAAARIGDRSLAAEYRRALLDQYFAQFRRGGPKAVRRTPPRPQATEAGADIERIRHLIAILLRHPVLLARLEERLASLDLPPPARRLLPALQSWSDQAESLDFDSLIAHLTSLRLTDDVAWALGDTPLPLPECASRAATVDDAEAGWIRIYGLMRRAGLAAELADARQAFATSFSAQALQRLMALGTELRALPAGDPDSETEFED